MGNRLSGIRKGTKVDLAKPPTERLSNQVVSEDGILGQEWTVQVGTIDCPADRTFGVVFTVVPESHNHLPEGATARSQMRPSAMVLKTHQRGLAELGGANDDIPDEPPSPLSRMDSPQI